MTQPSEVLEDSGRLKHKTSMTKISDVLKAPLELPAWLQTANANASRSTLPPNIDLIRQYEEIKDEVEPAVLDVLRSGKYILGPQVKAFEAEYAAYCQTKYCVGISSGTEALHLALAALGIGPGDEVITACNTYIATALAITYTGATPVFADVEPETFNVSAATVAPKITPRTKAILPVHLYGHPVDMDPLLSLARLHNLYVVEDAAHAHGAEYKGRRAGSLGHIGCFSFYPGKNLGAGGDAGAVTTNDPEMYEKVKILRYVGQRTKWIHDVVGFQQRLDEVQAAFLRPKLRRLDRWNDNRRRVAEMYDEWLTGLPLELPREAPYARHVYYNYVVRLDAERRDAFIAHLAGRGVATVVMYPTMVPLQPAYQDDLGYTEADFPAGVAASRQLVNLPIFAHMQEDEVQSVANAIRSFFDAPPK